MNQLSKTWDMANSRLQLPVGGLAFVWCQGTHLLLLSPFPAWLVSSMQVLASFFVCCRHGLNFGVLPPVMFMNRLCMSPASVFGRYSSVGKHPLTESQRSANNCKSVRDHLRACREKTRSRLIQGSADLLFLLRDVENGPECIMNFFCNRQIRQAQMAA